MYELWYNSCMATYLFAVTDPQGRRISLTTTCYHQHILFEHPDMDDSEEIAQAIEHAEYITSDTVDTNRLVYYRTYRRRPQRWFIKVVVDISSGGEVVTAYRVRRMKQSENILWQR